MKTPSNTIHITRAQRGRTVAEVVRFHLELSWGETRRLIKEGQVRVDGEPCTDPMRRVQTGQHLDVPRRAGRVNSSAKPAATSSKQGAQLRHVDEHILVVEKPAGLTTMRHSHEAAEFGSKGKRFLPATLADQLPGLLRQQGHKGRPIAVHRLDRDTSGLVIFARTPEAARHLGKQFRDHSIERRYLAVVRGQARDARIESRLVDDRGDGRRGSTTEAGQGQRAVTLVRAVEPLGDFTLVECRLETGRTHQVRIHLGERGTPICGEKIYDRPIHGKPFADGSDVERLALHAAFLEIEHPATGKRVSWTSPLPVDLKALVKRVRNGSA